MPSQRTASGRSAPAAKNIHNPVGAPEIGPSRVRVAQDDQPFRHTCEYRLRKVDWGYTFIEPFEFNIGVNVLQGSREMGDRCMKHFPKCTRETNRYERVP